MPLRLPSLSNKATTKMIFRLAIGATVIWLLLLGVKYGSSGEIIRLLAKTTEGGKAKVEYRELSISAVAKVVRSVVIAGVGICYPIMLLGLSAWAIMPLIFASNCADIL